MLIRQVIPGNLRSFTIRSCRWNIESTLRKDARRVYSVQTFQGLVKRGLIQEVFPPDSEEVFKAFSQKQCIYCGFDPTADSLHVGNLLTLVFLLHLQRMRHEVIAVIGDATVQIGDPSGRLTERQKLEDHMIENNIKGIKENLELLFLNHEEYFWKQEREKKPLPPIKILRNSDWYDDKSVVPFLSSLGRYFRVGKMLTRTSVQQRMNTGEGMSFSEFSYQMFQAYDWLYLFDKYGCKFQVGGGDQLGNIDAGYDLIRRARRKPAFGLLVPLITAESGDKYGKSAGNAIWLNPDKTSPYDFYQFFIRLSDKEAIQFLKLFTFCSLEEIEDLIQKHMESPEKRIVHRRIAKDMTLLVHGEEGLKLARKATDILFNGKSEVLNELNEKDLKSIFGEASYSEFFYEPGTTILDMSLKAKLFPTEDDAHRIIKAGGLYVNQNRVSEPRYVIVPGVHVLPSGYTLARVGKKNYYLIKWLV